MRIAVAGAGVFGRHHLRVLKSLPNVELTGVFDADPARTAAAAAEYGVAAFGSLEELAGAADAAVVAIPDEQWGEGVGACVVLKDGSKASVARNTSRLFGIEVAGKLAEGGLLIVSEPPDVTQITRWPRAGLGQLGLKRLTSDDSRGGYVVLEKIRPTPSEFPRRVGTPGKKPLFS